MSKQRGPTRRRPTPHILDGVPGSVEPGYREQPIVKQPLPAEAVKHFEHAVLPDYYTMGPCRILIAREPAGVKGELLWHLTISEPSRHPTWDEIKVARYRLLPPDACFALLLPPTEVYVNAHDHVFQLWEVTDPREPWTGL